MAFAPSRINMGNGPAIRDSAHVTAVPPFVPFLIGSPARPRLGCARAEAKNLQRPPLHVRQTCPTRPLRRRNLRPLRHRRQTEAGGVKTADFPAKNARGQGAPLPSCPLRLSLNKPIRTTFGNETNRTSSKRLPTVAKSVIADLGKDK